MTTSKNKGKKIEDFVMCRYKNCKKEVWNFVCNGYCKKHHDIKCLGKRSNLIT